MGASVYCLVALLFYGMARRLYSHFPSLQTRHGHGGAGFFPVVSKMIIQSGASFGLFMAVGGLVRCDDQNVFRNGNDRHFNQYLKSQ